MVSDTPVIKMKSVLLRYGNGEKAIKNLTLSFYSSSLQFVTGPSGAGKTSILKLVNLDEFVTDGNLEILGVDVSKNQNNHSAISSLKRQIGYIPQNIKLIEHLSAIENVALPLKIVGVTEKERLTIAKEMLSWLNIPTKQQNVYPCELSAGHRQLIAIARAVIKKPKIILADAPIMHLNARIANKVLSLFLEFSKNRQTCVIITNNNEQIIPPLLNKSREIKILAGMLADNFGNIQPNEFQVAV